MRVGKTFWSMLSPRVTCMQSGRATEDNQREGYAEEGRDREAGSALEEGEDSSEWFLPGQCFLGHLDPTTASFTVNLLVPPQARGCQHPQSTFHSVFNCAGMYLLAGRSRERSRTMHTHELVIQQSPRRAPLTPLTP